MLSGRLVNILLFSLVYFAQGSIISYFAFYNILYLTEFGHSRSDVGFFQSIVAIPMVAKILFGFISDRFSLAGMGHRKPYIFLGLASQGIAGLYMTFMEPTNLTLFGAVAFLAAAGMALYDTTTDGLAVDAVEEKDQGIVQGFMVGARAAGATLFLLFGGFIVQNQSWTSLFISIAVIPFIPAILILFIRFPEEDKKFTRFEWSTFRSLKNSGVLFLALMATLYAFASDGIYTFWGDYLKEGLQYNFGPLGVTIAIAMAGRMIGALLSGFVSNYASRKNLLIGGFFATAFGALTLSLEGGIIQPYMAGFIFGFAYGFFNAVYAAAVMGQCESGASASMFAIFMMFFNLGTVLASAAGGLITERYGFLVYSASMAPVLILSALTVIPFIRGNRRARA